MGVDQHPDRKSNHWNGSKDKLIAPLSSDFKGIFKIEDKGKYTQLECKYF